MDYLEFYKHFAKEGQLPAIGLCNSLPLEDIKLISPTRADRTELQEEGACPAYWASGYPMREWNNFEEMYGFTPLRQTLVILLAAYYDQL